MGDNNQTAYLMQWAPECDGPVLEVGSKEYGSTFGFRKLYPRNEYVGVDMIPGEGVDVVADLSLTIGPLRPDHFALAICCSVLEHVAKPWHFAENLTRVLRLFHIFGEHARNGLADLGERFAAHEVRYFVMIKAFVSLAPTETRNLKHKPPSYGLLTVANGSI